MANAKISAVGVVGAGVMGHGLALEFARGGYDVWLQDVMPAQLSSALPKLKSALALLTELGLATSEEAERAPARVRLTADLRELARNADFVVEAVKEDLEVKREVFASLDQLCRPGVILASNTSAFSPTDLGDATKRPDRVLVTHYFNPPYLLPAVEVVPGRLTSRATVEAAVALCQSIGKQPVVLKKEVPGFVSNRLQFALYREASALVEQGVVSAEDLDRLVVTSIGNRLGVFGPITIADLGGLDVYESICRTVYPRLSRATGPSPALVAGVAKGRLGAKSGQGVYEWPAEKIAAARRRLAEHAAMMFGGRDRS